MNIIDNKYADGKILIDYLYNQKELTLLNEAETNFSKNILLSSASYFEKEIVEIIKEFARNISNNNELLISIVEKRILSRQYHTFFDWDKTNANSFFSMFGDAFSKKMKDRVKADQKLDESIRAFLQIGNERNKLVHLNYAEVTLDKTGEEIYKLFQLSLHFIDVVRTELSQPIHSLATGAQTSRRTNSINLTPILMTIIFSFAIIMIIYLMCK